MCGNNNGICSCFNNGNWWWIIILILLFCNGCGGSSYGNGCYSGNSCYNDNNNNCGCC